uniref:Ovule protein n=1 Tax=Rhabditophanes sp. KR3021 TaxID=114890 RepID=A0AC35U013_9BILA
MILNKTPSKIFEAGFLSVLKDQPNQRRIYNKIGEYSGNDQSLAVPRVHSSVKEKKQHSTPISSTEFAPATGRLPKRANPPQETILQYPTIVMKDGKKSSTVSVLRKMVGRIPFISCITCTPSKTNKCTVRQHQYGVVDREMYQQQSPKRNLAIESSWKKERLPPPAPPLNPEQPAPSKHHSASISTTAAISHHIHFLDDDIMDQANYLTHPIYLFPSNPSYSTTF